MTRGASSFDYASVTVPPEALFVAADEPLLVYPSIAAAERHLEAIDVRNNVYPAAYGANGEPYRIDLDDNHVVIKRIGETNRPDELKLLLLRYLEAIGRTTSAAATFDDLVATVWTVERDFWQEHDPYGDRFSKPIPLWGCLTFLVFVTAVLYLVFR